MRSVMRGAGVGGHPCPTASGGSSTTSGNPRYGVECVEYILHQWEAATGRPRGVRVGGGRDGELGHGGGWVRTSPRPTPTVLAMECLC